MFFLQITVYFAQKHFVLLQLTIFVIIFFSYNNLFVSYADFQGDKDYHFTGIGIEWREQKKIQFLPAHEKDVKVDDSRITK